MNTLFITGRLTKDPEQRTTKNGTQFVTFSIAENKGKDSTLYWDCQAWGTAGENIAKYFKKGSFIILVGSIEYSENDGKRYYKIVVTKFDFPPKPKQEQATSQYDEQDTTDIDLEDIVTPF